VGLKLIFLIVTPAVSVLGLSRREAWWKDAEILILRHQLAVALRERPRVHPWHRPQLLNLDDYDIVRIYAAEYRGIVNYYLLAHNVWRLATLRWNAETSMLKTLAAKHKSTVATMAARQWLLAQYS